MEILIIGCGAAGAAAAIAAATLASLIESDKISSARFISLRTFVIFFVIALRSALFFCFSSGSVRRRLRLSTAFLSRSKF